MEEHFTDKHYKFILETLVPIIKDQARVVGCDTFEVVGAIFVTCGSLLLAHGLTPETLMRAIRANTMHATHTPGTLQSGMLQ